MKKWVINFHQKFPNVPVHFLMKKGGMKVSREMIRKFRMSRGRMEDPCSRIPDGGRIKAPKEPTIGLELGVRKGREPTARRIRRLIEGEVVVPGIPFKGATRIVKAIPWSAPL